MQHQQIIDQYIAIIISEVRSSSRELYPLTKNYPMGLLPIGSKKIINYQLETLITIQQLSKVVIVVGQEDQLLQEYIQNNFVPNHRDYPHKIEIQSLRDLSNTFSAVKNVLKTVKQPHRGYIILHADTICSVSLADVQTFHQTKKSDLTILGKAKRQLGQLQKKLPQGEIQTQIDNILMGDNNECIFIDMAEEIDNSGVKIDPSIFKQVRKATFKRFVDSKIYFITETVAKIIRNLSSQEIYEVKPWLIQLLVQNQTNKKLLELAHSSEQNQLLPLKIFVHFNEQDTYIRKINSKKIYQTLNFQSLIRGPKQRDILLPTAYSEKLDQRKQYKGAANVAENAIIGLGARIRRSCIGANCKIGKNVELINCILLEGVEVKDGCKISECVIGSGTLIGEGTSLKNIYSESGCRVADGLKIESQVLIRNQ